MSITVYTKPACVQCNATKRALDKQGLDYTTVDVTQDADALGHIKDLGYSQAPVVEAADDNHWSGYRPDRIKALATAEPTDSLGADPFSKDPFSAKSIGAEFQGSSHESASGQSRSAETVASSEKDYAVAM